MKNKIGTLNKATSVQKSSNNKEADIFSATKCLHDLRLAAVDKTSTQRIILL